MFRWTGNDGISHEGLKLARKKGSYEYSDEHNDQRHDIVACSRMLKGTKSGQIDCIDHWEIVKKIPRSARRHWMLCTTKRWCYLRQGGTYTYTFLPGGKEVKGILVLLLSDGSHASYGHGFAFVASPTCKWTHGHNWNVKLSREALAMLVDYPNVILIARPCTIPDYCLPTTQAILLVIDLLVYLPVVRTTNFYSFWIDPIA